MEYSSRAYYDKKITEDDVVFYMYENGNIKKFYFDVERSVVQQKCFIGSLSYLKYQGSYILDTIIHSNKTKGFQDEEEMALALRETKLNAYRQGEWLEFDSSGVLLNTENWIMGKRVVK